MTKPERLWCVVERRADERPERGDIVRSQLTERGAKRVAAKLKLSGSGTVYRYEAKRYSEY